MGSVAGNDDVVRAVPQPPVRPLPSQGLLPPGRVLQQHRRRRLERREPEASDLRTCRPGAPPLAASPARFLGARSDRRPLHSLMAHMEATLYPRGRIAAASFTESESNGGENEAVSPKLERGSYVRYNQVELTGMASIAFGFRVGDAPGAIEVRIGSLTGPVIARVPIVKAAK